MVDVAVYLVLVDALGEQLRDDVVDVTVGGVIGEAARIGHHTTVNGNGEMLAQFIEESHLPHHAEHQFAR